MSQYIVLKKKGAGEEGGWEVLPLQGISPQLRGYNKDEDCKDTEKLSKHAATQALFINTDQQKDSCALLTLHLTLLLKFRTAFLLHIEPSILAHSENYRGNKIKVFWLPMQTPAIDNPVPFV